MFSAIVVDSFGSSFEFFCTLGLWTVFCLRESPSLCPIARELAKYNEIILFGAVISYFIVFGQNLAKWISARMTE